MTDVRLAGKSVAILVANGFEELEMTETQRALLKAGAAVKVISPEQGLVNGWMEAAWGHYFPVDCPVSEVLGSDFHMLVLPGGVRGIAKLKQNAHVKRIISHFMDAGKPVAAIDQGVELLAFVQKIAGRTLTAPQSLRPLLEEAGATWSDDLIVRDGQILTAQSQEVLAAFVMQTLTLCAGEQTVQQAA